MIDEHSNDDRPQLTEDVVSLIVASLEGRPGALAEFHEGLGKHLYRLSENPTEDTRLRLLRFVTHWAVDSLLAGSESWRTQVEQSERDIADRKLGDPVDGPGLRQLLLR